MAICCSTRIITYAWGEKYLNQLLELALPAVLAPGNLPYVASVAPCEFVILTEEASFSKVLAAPAVIRIREICSLRLLGLDDLITSPDQYGIALTYALHRGFADLGPSVTDTWLIFLNADFIIADGSWRNLLKRFMEGERVVASPSYCVETSSTFPELQVNIDPCTRALAMAPRDMAGLILRRRHNTIRGKTVNNSTFSMRYMDQFYWLINEETLIGHQMPVAIVGMRPERYVEEPNSFWDYGFIKELCPDTDFCVLGDSDDFLMAELRDRDVGKDQIIPGWPSFEDIGALMITWVTPYQKAFAQYPLTLHAGDVPSDADEARARLRTFVDQVLYHVPADLPSHVGHPQWDYHRSRFFKYRHQYLSHRLGHLTETGPPPPSIFKLDQIWWQLDGLEKTYLSRRRDLNAKLRIALRAARAAWSGDWSDGREAGREFGRALLAAVQTNTDVKTLFENILLAPNMPNPSDLVASPYHHLDRKDLLAETLDRQEQQGCVVEAQARPDPRVVPLLMNRIRDHYRERLSALDFSYSEASAKLKIEYHNLLPSTELERLMKAATEWSATRTELAPSRASRVPRFVITKLLGRVPYVSRLHPYWAALRHIVRIADNAQRANEHVLLIGPKPGIVSSFAHHLTAHCSVISLSDLKLEDLYRRLGEIHSFGLCIWELGPHELLRFTELTGELRLFMRPGSTIVGLYFLAPDFVLNNSDHAALIGLKLAKDIRIHYAGSATAKAAIMFNKIVSLAAKGIVGKITAAMMAPIVLCYTLIANLYDAKSGRSYLSEVPVPCTSVTLEVSIPLSS